MLVLVVDVDAELGLSCFIDVEGCELTFDAASAQWVKSQTGRKAEAGSGPSRAI